MQKLVFTGTTFVKGLLMQNDGDWKYCKPDKYHRIKATGLIR
jgi:hypothetical protein